jgi:hypothetical protein
MLYSCLICPRVFKNNTLIENKIHSISPLRMYYTGAVKLGEKAFKGMKNKIIQ